jgi:branched-chain amino acid transport system substrate-binding protein
MINLYDSRNLVDRRRCLWEKVFKDFWGRKNYRGGKMKRFIVPLLTAVMVVSIIFAGCMPAAAPPPVTPPPVTPPPVTPPPVTPPPVTPPPVAPPEAPDKITFAAIEALSGWWASFSYLAAVVNYTIWEEKVNAEGGIYVREYDKRIPVEIKWYDSKSDPAVAVTMAEKAIVADKVDFVISTYGTAWCFAVAPIVDQYGYVYFASNAASTDLVKMAFAGDLTYTFQGWPVPDDSMPQHAALLNELGVKSIALIYIETLYGVDLMKLLRPDLEEYGIEVVVDTSYPVDIMDISPILKTIRDADPDAVFQVSYVDDAALTIEQMMALDYNPKLFYTAGATWGSGVTLPKFGAEAMEGIMGECAWNKDMAGLYGAQEYYDAYLAEAGVPTCSGMSLALQYAQLEVLQQAIEEAGTLDNTAVRDVIQVGTFHTVVGDIWFGEGDWQWRTPTAFVGQWHNGLVESLMPLEKRTMDPIYPKPPWPK